MKFILSSKRAQHWILLFSLFFPLLASAQNASVDSTLQNATLDRVITYALANQPAIKQAELDREITEKAIKGRLADWYPQINFGFNYVHTFDLQTQIFGDAPVQVGLHNTSAAQFTATQNVFNRDVLLASSTASKVRTQADNGTEKSKIDVVVNVTKAFYDLLTTAQQIRVSEESVRRLQRSLKDAYSRYNSGLTDKTDYKRATILLGNAEASLKANVEMLTYKESFLKTQIGFPQHNDLSIQYDTLQMESEISMDTLRELNYASHIDYKILFMQRELQDANVKYSNWSFLPTLNLNGAYNYTYLNNNLSDLYKTSYPYSFVGATVALPLFQGGKRVLKIQEQKLSRQRIDVGLNNLQSALQTEYARALASYKSNLANYVTQKENVTLAKEVYDVIQLQYRSGVKTYLDVTVAESDLRTTRINYFNSLYQVLASKMDVLKALGQINY